MNLNFFTKKNINFNPYPQKNRTDLFLTDLQFISYHQNTKSLYIHPFLMR